MVMLSPVLLGSEQLMGELMSQLPRAAGRRIVPEPTIGQSWRGYSEESVSDARCLQGTDDARAAALLGRLIGTGGTESAFSQSNQWWALQQWSGGIDKLASHMQTFVKKCSYATSDISGNYPEFRQFWSTYRSLPPWLYRACSR